MNNAAFAATALSTGVIGAGTIWAVIRIRAAMAIKRSIRVTQKSADDLYGRVLAASNNPRWDGVRKASMSPVHGMPYSSDPRHSIVPHLVPLDDMPDAWVEFDSDAPPTKLEVTSIETCSLCEVKDGQHELQCPQRIIDDIFGRTIGDGWKQAMMPELFVSRILTADEIAELEDYPLPEALASPPNIGGMGKPKYQGGHYDSTHGAETRFVPYDMLGEPMRGTAVHAIGRTACVGPIDLSPGEPSHAEPHHFTTVRE